MLIVEAIHAFNDNYIWFFHNGTEGFVVDPGDASVVIHHLEQRSIRLQGILITHWHADHTGGIAALTAHYNTLNTSPIRTYGPASIAGITHALEDADKITLLDTSFSILATPGHTLDHISYVAVSENILFCGDTLFTGGCGRMFEGTPPIYLASLDKLAALPPTTRIYCAHEYTVNNCIFAQEVEPHNKMIQKRLFDSQKRRSEQKITVPTTLELELLTNPFLRTRQPDVVKTIIKNTPSMGVGTDPVSIFASLRQWKDNF